MRSFVKNFSIILLFFLTGADLITLAVTVCSIMLCIWEILNPVHGTIDGAETPILDFVGQSIMVFIVVLLILFLLIVIAEIILKILFVNKAVKHDRYGFYLVFSMIGIIEVILNTFIILHELLTGSFYHISFEIAMNTAVNVAVLINICSLVLLIPVLICANSVAKKENP